MTEPALATVPLMPIRRLIFWPHLIAGVLAGLVIVIMSVTGVLLTYERQLIAWSDSHLRSVPPSPGAARLPVETLLERVRARTPRRGADGASRSARRPTQRPSSPSRSGRCTSTPTPGSCSAKARRACGAS